MNTQTQIINFLKYLSLHGVSPKSLKYYKSDIVNFLNWAKDKKISQELIHEYINSIRLITPASTLNRRISTLRSYSTFMGFKKVSKSWQESILSKFSNKPNVHNFLNKLFFNRPNWYKRYHSFALSNYIHVAILVLFTSIAGYAFYDQVFKNTSESSAFPSALTRPNRYLSFQGRLTDNLGNPKTVATNMVFQLYTVSSGGTAAWTSNTCSITPDQDGIFSTLLGTTTNCPTATEIPSDVFSQNAAIWLGTTMGADAEATPRVQIATVAYSLNSETLQGYPAGTGTSTIPYINSTGNVVLANASPKIQSTSGTFAVEGLAMTLTTPNTSDGVIAINPDGVGTLDLNFEGTAPGLSQNGFVNAINANLSTGSLYSGTVANTNTGYNFINFLSGSPATSKFKVDYAGNTTLASGATLTIGTTSLSETTSPTDSGGYLIGVNDEFAYSASTNVQAVLNDLDAAIAGVGGTGDITAVGSMVSGDAFADATADDDWLGLGVAAGRIEFDDQTTDEVNILNASVGIGTSTPTSLATTIFGAATFTNNLTVYKSITDLTATNIFTNNLSDLVLNPGANSSNVAVSNFNEVSVASGNAYNISSILGTTSYINHQGNGTVDTAIAGDFKVALSGSGDYSNTTGLNVYVDGGTFETKGLDVYSLKTFASASDVYGSDLLVENSGVTTTGIDSTYGSNLYIVRTGATGGTIDTYGENITLTLDNAGAGTHTAYGLKIDFASEADINHAIYTDGGDWTNNFLNNAGSATTQNAFTINNTANGSASTDTTTENLLLIQQLDTSVGDSKLVEDGIMVDVAGNSGMTNAINITNSAGNLTTGLKIADSAGGTLTTGISLSGTFTTGIDAGNSIITNIGNSGTDFNTSGGLTLAENLTVQGTTGLTFAVGAGGDITFAFGEKIDNDSDGKIAITATTTDLSGNLEVTGGNILNSSGTANIIFSATPTTTANELSASNWYINNTANVGQAALIVNQTKSGDLLTASVSGVTKMSINPTGDINLGYSGTSVPATTNPLMIYNHGTTNVASIDTAGHLILSDDINVNGGDIITTAATFNVANAATTLNLGQTNVTRTINLGTGTSADTINIGTGATTADAINIGGLSTSTVAINTGAWTFTNDTNFVLSGGVNGMSFDTTTLSIDATNDRVGIGLTDPSRLLHLSQSSVTTSNGQQIFINQGSTGDSKIGFEISGVTGWDIGIDNSDSDKLKIINTTGTGDFSTLATGITIDTAGNVGIGTTSPATLLDLDSNSNSSNLRLRGADETNEMVNMFVGSAGDFSIDLTGGNDTAQYFNIATEDNEYGVIIRNSLGTSNAWTNLYMNDAATDYLNIVLNAANSTLGLVIEAGGNIGVGIDPVYKMDVAGVIRGQAAAGSGDVLMVGNDTKIVDIDVASTLGIYSTSDTAVGGLRFGTGGGTIFGASGNIGINTTPVTNAKLNVVGTADNRSALFVVPTVSAGTTNFVVATDEALGTDPFVAFTVDWDGTPNNVFRVTTGGAAYADGGWNGAADFAEYFNVDDTTIEKGELMSFNASANKTAGRASGNNTQIIGVVSTNPGFIGIPSTDVDVDADRYSSDPNWKIVGLLGQVPTYVSNENGPINVGDPITTSSVNGVGMKATNEGYIVGRAMESFNSSDKGKITVFVQPTWYDPDLTITADGDIAIQGQSLADYSVSTPTGTTNKIGAFASAAIAKLKVGFGSFKQVETNLISPVANADLIIDLQPNDAEAATKLVIKGEDNQEVASIDATGKITANSLQTTADATISGTLYADKIESSRLSEIEGLLSEVESNQQLLTESQNWNANTATESGKFTDVIANTIQTSDLFVTGQAALSSLFVSDNITTKSLDSLNSVLSIQSLASAPLEIMAGKIKIDVNGNAIFLGNIEVAGNIKLDGNFVIASDISQSATPSGEIVLGETTSNSTAGKATLAAGLTELKIKNSRIKDSSLIYVTPVSSTQNKVLYVKSKSTGEFTVGFNEGIDTTVEFNWWIIELESI